MQASVDEADDAASAAQLVLGLNPTGINGDLPWYTPAGQIGNNVSLPGAPVLQGDVPYFGNVIVGPFGKNLTDEGVTFVNDTFMPK